MFRAGQDRAVKWLLHCGAMDTPNPEDGLTAFDIARENANLRMATLLRAHAMPAVVAPPRKQRRSRKDQVNWWSVASKNAPHMMKMNRPAGRRGVMTL